MYIYTNLNFSVPFNTFWCPKHLNIFVADYRFLEETGRKVDSTSRDDLKRKRGQPNFVGQLSYLHVPAVDY